MGKVTDLVEGLAKDVAAKVGVNLWDIEYLSEGGDKYLRFFIDRDEGIGTIQCEQFSKAIDPLLDSVDALDGAYILEVSSPGVERVLKKPEHFLRYIGATVEVRLYKAISGAKKHTGVLESYSEDGLSITESGEALTFPLADVSKVQLKVDFSLF